ncbi:hypothetical protein VTK73DRAFT_7392 [Phialemonium thermophilum]|uniref:Zn(2)-C6 fungal-type domain-containing protein n=1 Tax=Phialemonium thermophilum TaxID=223376 RepID=A0ABR3XSW2_9PEZI
MTGALNSPCGTTKDAASARKRRRRAPAGGAADDCFTCSKRNVKCDRRRPYCSQCLEIGNECSGYKTQLTWGVGVASRGKLRGLSLPIAKAPPVSPVNPVKKPAARPRAGSNVVSGQWNEQEEQCPREDAEPHIEQQQPAVPPTPFPAYDLCQMSSPENAPSITHSNWAAMHFAESLPTSENCQYHGRPVPLSLPGTGEMLSASLDSMGDMDYMSPLSHSYQRDDISFIQSPTLMYDSFPGHGSPISPSPVSGMMIEPPRPPTSCPSLVYAPSEPSSSLHSHIESYDVQTSRKLMNECDTLVPGTPDVDVYSTSTQSQGAFWAPFVPEEETAANSVPEHSPIPWPSAFQPRTLSVSSDLIAKMPFFMDYYENTMCPSMVLVDGTNNPFRQHVLHLAASSRSLQHAICALAACNLRIKRKLSLGQHRREDLGEKRLDLSPDSIGDGPPEDQSLLEEYQHRNLAVHLLNEQLNDPEKARHDSALATILLLCHYRMAESGIAKFHTHFAGVKKILGMRRSSPFPPTGSSAWMEAIFTYFDAITASINDREAQLNVRGYGVFGETQLLPPGAENLVGCDRELFKTIFRLGRLNLLSQGRPVQSVQSGSVTRGQSLRCESPLNFPLGHSLKLGPSQRPSHINIEPRMQGHRFDGNGFHTGIDEDILSPGALPSPSPYEDHQSAFWREWKEARSALQSWEFDSQRVVMELLPGSSASSTVPTSSAPGSNPALGMRSSATSPLIRDLASLSEAFRYAALLYTERLANPSVPRTDNSFRNLVSQVVYYATSLESGSSAEKFLLWPLFVAGSECVNELQQNIVRSKCREIMGRSGYMNNLAALDILERLWATEPRDGNSDYLMSGGLRRGPFCWSKYIGGNVEWIMF